MKLDKTRYLLGIAGYGVLVSAVIAVVLHYFFPGFSWNWFAGVFLFFMVIESFIINLVINNSNNNDKKRLVNIYMLSKTVKIVLSLFFVLIYYLIAGGADLKMFIIVFVAFYFLFLLAETYLLGKIEKHIKLTNQNEQ